MAATLAADLVEGQTRVADEVSDAKAAEDLDLERDVQYPEQGAQ